MARIVLFLASFAFMVWAIAGQVEQQSLHRGSVARYGSFRQIPHRFLNATPVASSKVPDGLTCADSCLQHERCWSYNLRARPDGKGQYDCQLLATDRYSAPAHMEESLEFNHHSLMTACESSPCQNGGECKPIYASQGYRCDCNEPYSGENCHELENYLRRSDSVILKDHPDYEQTLKEFMREVQVAGKQWKLCYRASENSYTANAFHVKCDNKGPTVTLVRVGDNVFGGYTDQSWGTKYNGYISSKEAFLFSLKNRDNKVYKMDIIPGRNGGAMYTGSGYGPTFGEGIEIRDACRFNDHSKSSPGSNYQVPPGYTYGYSNTLLAGSYKFKCTEYEVFYQY